MAETIILDPTAVATGRTQLDITGYISADGGVNWDDARIEAYQAQGKIGADPVDYTIPNRQVVIPLKLKAVGATSFETIRRQLQAKAALFQREQGWLSRVTTAGTQYADVVNASLTLGGDWGQAYKSFDVNAELHLEIKPDWYGAEIQLDDQTETSAPELIRVLKLSSSDAVIAGDYPDRVRVVVDEDDGDTQLGLLWGFRSRFYDSASTAMLAYQAGSLTPLDTASTATISGAAGTVIRHGTLSTDWTPVLRTTILAGTADLTHKGSYRVWARCYTTSGTTPDMRFVWDVGDLAYPAENPQKTVPSASNFHIVDLGDVRLDPTPVGTHRWQGVIQAKGDSGGENLAVDRIWFQPLDDGAGRLTAAIDASPGLAAYAARDGFDQTAGTITGKTATVGGVWAGEGDTDDFNLDTSNHWITRTALSDSGTGLLSSRRIRLPVSMTATAVQADFNISARGLPGLTMALMARRVDANNFLAARALVNTSGTLTLFLEAWVTGTGTQLGPSPTLNLEIVDAWVTLRLLVTADGLALVWAGRADGTSLGAPAIATFSSVLATGGTLASGNPGIIDYYPSANALTRRYDNFSAWVPTLDASLYSNRSAQLMTDGIVRQDTTGTAYGPAFHTGDLPRLPTSGLENRKVELFLKASRGDFDQVPDSGIDDISARVNYRPCWLNTPGS